jgi:feruloyl-CoA synthase
MNAMSRPAPTGSTASSTTAGTERASALSGGVLDAPLRPVQLVDSDTLIRRRPDGTLLMTLQAPLGSYPEKLTERLVHWASLTPDRPLLVRRHAGRTHSLTFGEALRQTRAVGQALLNRQLSPDRPVVILSGNDFEHAVLALACYHVGVPYAPVSPPYSLMATDRTKLRHVLRLMQPGLVFASDGARYVQAIAAEVAADVEVVFTRNAVPERRSTPFSELLATSPTPAVEAAFERVTADTVGKVLFTSGTSGMPKGVIYTQRMLCSNRQQVTQTLAFLQDEPPVLVDWLPWHHTFGGTTNFGFALYGGGTLHIDDGKPLPGAVLPTIEALREVAPTMYFNTPKGFECLIPYLRSEHALRDRFFSRLKLIYYGAASLPLHIWEALDELAVQAGGERVLIVSGLGSTEAGPLPVTTLLDPRRESVVGLPVPGCELKLVPMEDRFEIRLRGPSITPGYWRDPVATATAFDDEGFFRMGDAVRFIDDAHPERGLKFAGRISENFKLTTGTWVDVSDLRDRLIDHFAPCLQEAVIAGHERDEVTALLFPDVAACRALVPTLAPGASRQAVVDAPEVRSWFAQRLAAFAALATGSATRVTRAVLEAELPSVESGELTDKSTISHRAVLSRRTGVVDELYTTPPPPRVIA